MIFDYVYLFVSLLSLFNFVLFRYFESVSNQKIERY